MDIGNALGDAYHYAVEAVWGKWVRWILLVVSSILFPLMIGYQMQVYRGIKPAPELADWVKLLVDGIMLFIIMLLYLVPFLIVVLLFIGAAVATGFVTDLMHGTVSSAMLAGIAGGILLAVIVAIVTSLLLIIAQVRFARTGSFGEAFNLRAILAHIGKIGWGSYLLALIIFWIVMIFLAGIIFLISLIPLVGWLIQLFLSVPLSLLGARYTCLLYDSAGPAPAPAP